MAKRCIIYDDGDVGCYGFVDDNYYKILTVVENCVL